MLKRLRFLKAPLIAMHVAEEITCDMLSQEEWLVLEQIEICLTMNNDGTVEENLGRGEVPNWIIGCVGSI